MRRWPRATHTATGNHSMAAILRRTIPALSLAHWSRTGVCCLLLIAGMLNANRAQASEEPLWEIGLGIGVVNFPAWRGADSSSNFTAPLPYVAWRGERFRADRDGARGLLVDRPRLEIDVSFDGAVPVDSDDNDAREGMDDLAPILEGGPSINWLLHEANHGLWRLRLPLRAAISIDDDSLNDHGWTATPMLNYRTRRSRTDWHFGASLGPRFASRRYHAYYYDVSEDDATAQRPAYNASSGYSGSTLMLSASHRIDRVWAGVFMRYDYLDGAAFEDSPLVQTRHAVLVGLGFSVVLWQSDRTVPIRP